MNDIYEVRICGDCHEEIKTQGCGDESWDVCTGCRNVEGPVLDADIDGNGEIVKIYKRGER